MSESFRVRPMTESDLPAVLHNERLGYSFPWSEQNLKSCLLGSERTWVGLSRERIVAHGVTSLVLDEGHVLNLCVGCRWQGEGLGRRMLQYLLDDLRGSGARIVFLEVRQGNLPARALYDRMGFAQIGVRRGYYPGGQEREDALVLRTVLSQHLQQENE